MIFFNLLIVTHICNSLFKKKIAGSIACLVIMYDGVWSLEGFNWVYEAEGSLTLTVRSDTTLEQMREILYKELEVDSLVYDLKLELCSLYMKGHRCPPEVIKKDSQLRTLLMRATMSNTELTSISVFNKF